MTSNRPPLSLSSLSDYKRYGRQMIIDGLGLPAQVKLQNASVLVIGAGGLGCPALQYLCAAGVGRIGIVDHDVVELSNLQRQVLHSEQTLGMSKVSSAAQALKRLNSTTRIETYNSALSPSNAESLLSSYDVILDCTDNTPARYLLSDTCVHLDKPLVSGAAQRLDGQLCVYNLPLPMHNSGEDGTRKKERGPCYRCLFPTPPAPEMAGSCEETGILGAVTGVIGSLQALEAIKLITGLHDGKPSLLIYSALSLPPFRSVKLRARRKTCPARGDSGESERIGKISELDYVAFCGGPRPDWVTRGLVDGGARRRINAKELNERLEAGKSSVRIVDVRSRVEFGICHLPNSQNIPLSELVASPSSLSPHRNSDTAGYTNHVNVLHTEPHTQSKKEKPLTVFVCRLGNDSQIAADALRDINDSQDLEHINDSHDVNGINGFRDSSEPESGEIVDLIGGLRSWAMDVDPEFPVY